MMWTEGGQDKEAWIYLPYLPSGRPYETVGM